MKRNEEKNDRKIKTMGSQLGRRFEGGKGNLKPLEVLCL
jgi:hypothetical protein